MIFILHLHVLTSKIVSKFFPFLFLRKMESIPISPSLSSNDSLEKLSDVPVMATNDEAANSKMAAISAGYYDDPFLVKLVMRRVPTISDWQRQRERSASGTFSTPPLHFGEIFLYCNHPFLCRSNFCIAPET